MDQIYLLQHSYEIDGYDETKLIGIYSSRKLAEKSMEICYQRPGFREYSKDCFHIDKYEVNKSYWEEGFISCAVRGN